MGVWIEISKYFRYRSNTASLPSWECGLKCQDWAEEAGLQEVTPFMGVWIEILCKCKKRGRQQRHSLHGSVDWNYIIDMNLLGSNVTPFMGVWIEIFGNGNASITIKGSLPSWECGLKLLPAFGFPWLSNVTPFMGVWIEIARCGGQRIRGNCHSLHGSVDWNVHTMEQMDQISSHSLHGSVDWNKYTPQQKQATDSHSLHGSVDWNR